MLKVTLECKNVRSERLAKVLSKVTDNFKLWIYGNMVYVLFNVKSLPVLTEFGRKLKRIKTIEFRFIKIETVTKREARKSNKHIDRRNR